MSPDVYGYIASAVVALFATLWGSRSSRRTAATEARVREITVNSEAARNAQETYSGIVADLRAEVTRLRGELADVRATLEAASSENTTLKAQVARMQRTLDRMTRLLEAHNIPLPVD